MFLQSERDKTGAQKDAVTNKREQSKWMFTEVCFHYISVMQEGYFNLPPPKKLLDLKEKDFYWFFRDF